MRTLTLLVISLHALILFGHDVAHRALGIGLERWQIAFAYAVIVAAPLVAAVALFTRFERWAYALLAVAMFGALAFSVYHHYVAVSPDHVSHLPAGEGHDLFRATAAAMALLEVAGVVAGTLGWRRSSR